MLAVHLAKLEKVLLVATLRYEERCLGELPVYLKRNDNLLSLAFESLAYLGYGCKQQLAVGFIELAFVLEGETLVYGAILYVYVVDEGGSAYIVVDDGEDVDVGYGVAHNLALGTESFDEKVLLFQLFGFLKLQFLCFSLHFLVHVLR